MAGDNTARDSPEVIGALEASANRCLMDRTYLKEEKNGIRKSEQGYPQQERGVKRKGKEKRTHRGLSSKSLAN